VEDAVDKFCTTSNIQGRRVEMGCMPVLDDGSVVSSALLDDGSVVSSDLLHAASDSWWREQLDLGISCSARKCDSTVVQSEKELGI